MIRAASLVDPVSDGIVSHSSGLEPPSKKSRITSCFTNDLSDDDKAQKELKMYLQQYPTVDIDSCPLKLYKEAFPSSFSTSIKILICLCHKYLFGEKI